ncbi:DUF2510 domain-containing protein [Nocardioides zeae]|uniref:DUF2510 domain-containing protein n=1 Tax=Nocardioides zeae TaxID=1457234 RepID=UPI00286C2A38|nr:DUF2510 domain-containing protein [Nocardioides zeae]
MSTPPGWYDDGSGTQRWWNGTTWGEQPPPPAFPAGGLPGQPGFPGAPPGQPTPGQPTPGQPTPGPKRTGLVVALVVALVAVVALVVVVLVLTLGGDDDRDDSSDRDDDRDRDRDARPSETVTSPTFDLPTDASEDDFCAAMQVAGEEILDQSTQEGDETVDFGVAIEVLKATGTPADIPDDARTGFEAIIEAMEAGNGLTVDEFEEQDEAELDGEEAFGDYYTETCASF